MIKDEKSVPTDIMEAARDAPCTLGTTTTPLREIAETIYAQLHPEVDDDGRPHLPYEESIETISRLIGLELGIGNDNNIALRRIAGGQMYFPTSQEAFRLAETVLIARGDLRGRINAAENLASLMLYVRDAISESRNAGAIPKGE